MIDRVTLTRDMIDAAGRAIARRGFVVTARAVEEAAERAVPGPRAMLAETFVADDLRVPLADPPYRHLFRGQAVQAAVANALLAVRLPGILFDELRTLKASDFTRYRHALTTAAVASRMLVAAVGEARGLPDMAAAGLLHDIGMRHVSFHLTRNGDALEPGEVVDVAAHPLLGAYHLATVLGFHPAVEAALTHHWSSGHGYPLLGKGPSRSVQVVGVASTFSALTQARPFRSEPYDARGAADLLIAEASAGRGDTSTVKLLVHALRGAQGEVRQVRFARQRLGHAPVVNRHTLIAPSLQSAV